MPNFRFHRGGFAESMATLTPVANIQELKNLIVSEWVGEQFDLDIQPYGYDDRVGKYLFIVRMAGAVIGFLDDEFELTDEELPRAGQQYKYKDKIYYLLNGKVHSKHPDTGDWYISVEYCDPNKVYNREARDFIKKFRLVKR